MPAPDRLPGSLQENLLTALVHSNEYGRVVAALVEPALFEGDYRIIAERSVDYWRRYGKAPGPHAADLLSDILEDKKEYARAGTFRSIIVEMLRLSESINYKYAVDSLRSFVRVQRFQGAVLDTARRLNAQRELALPEVEEMWANLLRERSQTMERGLSLLDTDRLISYLQTHAVEFTTGIDELDARGIVPLRGAAMLLLASTGIGKSWGLIHLAKRALMQRKKVFYASLELSEEQLIGRFYQSFFGASRWEPRESDPIMAFSLEKDALGQLSYMERAEIKPEFTFDGESLEDELRTRRDLMQGKFRNIEIKRFPMRGLTVNMLRGYLDFLEQSGFIPDVVVLDYIGIMKTDARDHRISLGRTFEDFRGMCVERSVAGITAQQMSRKAARTSRGGQTNVAEDWSLIGTADVCIAINATSAEKQYGLARVFVEKARDQRDRFGVVISQNYDTGQFVIDSAPLNEARFEDLKVDAGVRDGVSSDEDDED
jgi:hypothetical protein